MSENKAGYTEIDFISFLFLLTTVLRDTQFLTKVHLYSMHTSVSAVHTSLFTASSYRSASECTNACKLNPTKSTFFFSFRSS